MRAFRVCVFALFSFGFLFAVLNPMQAVADSSSSAAVIVDGDTVDDPAVDAGIEQSNVSKLLETLPDWLQLLSVLIAACASIAALTPSPKDDSALLILRKIIDFLALNFGGAKNANSTKTDKHIS
jgi:hypothetical protein